MRLSTIGALVVDHPTRGASHLAFATTHGHVALGSESDNLRNDAKAQVVAHFDT